MPFVRCYGFLAALAYDMTNMLKVQSERLAEQRKINEEHTRVLELQAKELLESFDERRHEAKLRRRAQAAQVFVSLEHDPLQDTVHANVLNMSAGLAAGLGLAIVFAISINRTEWRFYLLTRWRLALHHQLPWSLMDFLSDVHRRGVLMQAGAVYQFGTSNSSTGSPTGTRMSGKRIRQL